MTKTCAVITGSSGGIGSALVRAYLDDDYLVIGLDRHPSGVTYSGKFTEFDVDLREFSKNEDYRLKILDQIIDALPDKAEELIVINNAAEQIIKAVPNIHWRDWENSFAVNTIAPFFLVQGLMEKLIAARGHVVNISSIHSKLTKEQFTCYAASKSALDALTRSLALELSPKGVSVNAIAPAAISTEMLKEGFRDAPHKLKDLEGYHPSRSIGSPEQLASFVRAITEQKGGFLTGSVIEFTGGIAGSLHDPS